MLNSFLSGTEDEAHVIYLVTVNCSQKLDLMGPCFYLILQLLYNETIVHAEAILSWTKSAKERIASAETGAETEGKDTAAAEEDGGQGSQIDSEDGQITVSIEAMKKFLADVSFVNFKQVAVSCSTLSTHCRVLLNLLDTENKLADFVLIILVIDENI